MSQTFTYHVFRIRLDRLYIAVEKAFREEYAAEPEVFVLLLSSIVLEGKMNLIRFKDILAIKVFRSGCEGRK